MSPMSELSTKDRRLHRRVRLTLAGSYLVEGADFSCQTIDVSAGGLSLVAPIRIAVGRKAVVYLETLGRIEGIVVRHVGCGFAMTIEASQRKRDRIIDQLTWFLNRDALELEDDRGHGRVATKERAVLITLANGRTYSARLTDVSRSGAALWLEARVHLETIITIGQTRARVVRIFEGGIAVEFLRLIPAEFLDNFSRL